MIFFRPPPPTSQLYAWAQEGWNRGAAGVWGAQSFLEGWTCVFKREAPPQRGRWRPPLGLCGRLGGAAVGKQLLNETTSGRGATFSRGLLRSLGEGAAFSCAFIQHRRARPGARGGGAHSGAQQAPTPPLPDRSR